MEYSEKYNFYLPSRDGDDIADINQISDNFRIIEENIPSKKDLDNAIGNVKIEIDQTYNPNSPNAQSGKAVAQALSGKLDKQKNYELIATIKVTPDVDGKLPTVIRFNMDSNGNPFELTDFCLSMVLGATDGASAKLRFNLNGKLVFGSVNPSLTKSLQSWYINYMDLGSGKLYIAPNKAVALQTHPDQGTPYITGFIGNVLPPTFNGYSPITNIYIGIPDGIEKTFIEGSEFKLYGVRK